MSSHDRLAEGRKSNVLNELRASNLAAHSTPQYQEAMLQKTQKRPASIDASIDELATAVSKLYDTVETLASKLQPVLLPSGPSSAAECGGDIASSPSHIRNRIDGMTDGVQSTIRRLIELTNEVDL